MATYNSTQCELTCPRSLQVVNASVNLYIGDTSQMCEVQIGERYPFHERRQTQNGGPVEGVVEDAGYVECPSCGRDFFCEVEFRALYLLGVRPSQNAPPYTPDRIVEDVYPCPKCGSRQTRHLEFDNMAVGRFFCENKKCDFVAVSVWDSKRGVYCANGIDCTRVKT